MYRMGLLCSTVQFSIVETVSVQGRSTQAILDISIEATQTAASLLPVWDHLCWSQVNCIFAVVTVYR